jgi:hypothetical protein
MSDCSELPEYASSKEAVSESDFRQKVEEGLHQLDSGKDVDHPVTIKQLAKWLS